MKKQARERGRKTARKLSDIKKHLAHIALIIFAFPFFACGSLSWGKFERHTMIYDASMRDIFRRI
jgi:uncharacterized protein (DUF934 family)